MNLSFVYRIIVLDLCIFDIWFHQIEHTYTLFFSVIMIEELSYALVSLIWTDFAFSFSWITTGDHKMQRMLFYSFSSINMRRFFHSLYFLLPHVTMRILMWSTNWMQIRTRVVTMLFFDKFQNRFLVLEWKRWKESKWRQCDRYNTYCTCNKNVFQLCDVRQD